MGSVLVGVLPIQVSFEQLDQSTVIRSLLLEDRICSAAVRPYTGLRLGRIEEQLNKRWVCYYLPSIELHLHPKGHTCHPIEYGID